MCFSLTSATAAITPVPQTVCIEPIRADLSNVGQIPLRSWIAPEVQPQAVLLCLHGLGLNSGSFDAFARRMAPLGFVVYAMDLRGFGEWMHDGRKARGLNFPAATNDVGKILHHISKRSAGLPMFVLGESMGGAMAVHVAALYPNYLSGVVASAPSGQRFDGAMTDLDVAFHFLRGPRRSFNIGTRIIDQATDSPKLREVWSDDPLDRMKLSPRDLIRFQRFMDQNIELAKRIKSLPILVIQGSDDHLVKPKGSLEIYNDIPSPQKSLLVLGDAEHLIWEDAQFTDSEFQQLTAWFSKQLAMLGKG
jgi:acylglycerol lipase